MFEVGLHLLLDEVLLRATLGWLQVDVLHHGYLRTVFVGQGGVLLGHLVRHLPTIVLLNI